MSKAFDTVKRKDLFDILKDTLDEDKLHMIKILTLNVQSELARPWENTSTPILEYHKETV